VLTIYPQTSAAVVKNYFTATAADYYSEGQETPGRWGGKLSGLLGLRGDVEKADFDRMADNLHPQTGERLTLRTNDSRRIGYDFVVSGPKSFSVALGLAPEEDRPALQKAFDDASIELMEKHIEPDMLTRVRKDGAFDNRRTGNMCWAMFPHTSSRPVPGFVGDPQWHTHFFVFNASDDPQEERIKAGEFGNLKRDGEYYSAVFYSLLAKKLVELGYGIDRRGGKDWELAGVLQSMIDKFSKRRDQVLDKAEELGITRKARIAELTATTRSNKDKTQGLPSLRKEWDGQLSDSEREALAAVYRGVASTGPPVTAAEAVAYAIAHLSEKLSVFPERELKRVALLHGLGHVTVEQIEAELPRQGVFSEVIDGQAMATTAKLQAEENAIIAFAAGGKGTVEPVGVPDGLDRRLRGGKSLNDGQFEVVTGLLNSDCRVNVVEGPAGAGKSSMLAKYDEAMRTAGQSVTYLATTNDAADELAKGGFKVNTVARFLLDAKMQAAAIGGRVVVDEVSMLDHKQAVKLFDIARENDLKLICIGDPYQHGAVARGAFMRIIRDYGNVQPFRLTEILRQENPQYREAASLLSQGKAVEGFDAIDGMGRVVEIADDTDRNRHIAADYLQAVEDRKSVLVVSPTHAEAKGITAAIRQELREAGCIEGDDREFTRLVQVDASEAQRGQASTYRGGPLVLQFHQNAKGGFTKGDRLAVTDPAKVPLSEAARFSLYRPEKIALAAGDKIRFTGTVKTMDGQHTLKNGMVKTVSEITPGGNIRLDNNWVVGKDAGHFRHGYVETSFGAQGRTVDRVILGMSSALSLPAINMQQLYVSASRAREWIRLYTDSKHDIRDAVKRSSHKLAALDLKPPAPQEEAKPQRWHRLRKHMERLRRLAVLDRTRAAWEKQPKQRQKERQADHGYSR
jgi:conjugative relaxase-like TrwC/TraI family protein